MPCSPKVYIVLVNWNGWKDTIECLESIYRSDYANYQVIIVDNGSGDGSVEYLKAWAKRELCPWSPVSNTLRKYSIPPVFPPVPCVSYTIDEAASGGDLALERSLVEPAPPGDKHPLILIEGKDNPGFGKGNNAALRYIAAKNDHDYVWLLNNDTVIAPASLSLMVGAAGHSPAIIGSVIRFYDSPDCVQAYGGGWLSTFTGRVRTERRNITAPLNHINGASFMVDRETLNRVGLFDEHLFMYFEETEYCMRAVKQQVRFLVSEAIVYHKVGMSHGKDKTYFSWTNVYRNKFYSFMKHYGVGFWLLCFWASLIINMINVRSDVDKRKASVDAFLDSLARYRGRLSK